jgi:hypothetical protein
VLRFIVIAFKVMAILEVIIGLVMSISASRAMQFIGGGAGLAAWTPILGGILLALYTWAAGDFISLAMAVEENTRAIRMKLK